MRSLIAFAYAFWVAMGIGTAASRGPSDPAELQAFVDQLFARHMAATHTPGAVFVLVKDGRVMFMKGYGFASLEKRHSSFRNGHSFASRPYPSSFPQLRSCNSVSAVKSISTRTSKRRLEHTGGLPGFQSFMRIVPAEDIGYFASATNVGGFFLPDLFRELEERYWPAAQLPAKITPIGARSDASRYAGSYRWNVYSRTTMGKFGQLVEPHLLTVTANADGTLSTTAFFSHPAGTWFEVRPTVFQEAGNEDKMAFRTDDRGRVTHALMVPDAFDKEAWYDWRPLHWTFIAICAALFLSACAGWPAAAFVRRLRRRRRPVNRAWRNAALFLGIVCAVNLVYPPLLGVTIDRYHRDFGAGIPPAFTLVRGIAMASAVATPLILVLALVAWKRKYWSPLARVHYSAVALAAAFWVPYLTHWNLLGFGA